MAKTYLYLLLTLAALLVSSCRTLAPISGGTHTIEVLQRYDSICREHYRYMYITGDTIYITDSIYIDRWRIKHDSICRNDTIYVPQYYEPDDYQFCKRSAIGFYIGIAVMVLGIGFVIIGRCLLR